MRREGPDALRSGQEGAGIGLAAAGEPLELLGHGRCCATAISGDGSTVVGYAGNAFRWTSATGMVDLGTLPGGSGSEAGHADVRSTRNATPACPTVR
jgi:probable HAF family extracellular repeat protein